MSMFKVTLVVETGAAGQGGQQEHGRRACCVCGHFLAHHNTFPTCGFCYRAATQAAQDHGNKPEDQKPEDKKPEDKKPEDNKPES
jgi:ribosomal protein S27AE